MEEITEEFYLENRIKTTHHKDIFFFGPGVSYSLGAVREKIEEAEKELNGKENVNIWVDASQYDEEGESYLMASWLDWETKEEFEQRMWQNKWAKERAVESLKRLINNNKEEAVEIIKELGLI